MAMVCELREEVDETEEDRERVPAGVVAEGGKRGVKPFVWTVLAGGPKAEKGEVTQRHRRMARQYLGRLDE
jgi:hypothetical protein